MGACGHPHISKQSHFFLWVFLRVYSKFVLMFHIPMLATYPTQAVLHTDLLLHCKHLLIMCQIVCLAATTPCQLQLRTLSCRLYINYQLLCTDYYLFIKYYSPLHVSNLKGSSSGGYSCAHAAYGTVTLCESSRWLVGTQLQFSLKLCTNMPPRTLIESDSTICCMCTTVSS